MGGEKSAVLVYGPKTMKKNLYWIMKFKVIDFKTIADSKRSEIDVIDKRFEGMSDLEVVEKSYKEDYSDFYNMERFLERNGMSIVYEDNYNWDVCRIGLIVKNLKDLTREKKDTIKNFCKEYELPSPTVFAGIIGEFE